MSSPTRQFFLNTDVSPDSHVADGNYFPKSPVQISEIGLVRASSIAASGKGESGESSLSLARAPARIIPPNLTVPHIRQRSIPAPTSSPRPPRLNLGARLSLETSDVPSLSRRPPRSRLSSTAMQPLHRSPSLDDGHLSPDLSVLLGLEKRQRKISRTHHFTTWYTDSREGTIDSPLLEADAEELQDGDLYLHRDGDRGELMRMWVRVSAGGNSRWIRAYNGTRHPTLPDRQLGLTKRDKLPGWLTEASAMRYRHTSRNKVA